MVSHGFHCGFNRAVQSLSFTIVQSVHSPPPFSLHLHTPHLYPTVHHRTLHSSNDCPHRPKMRRRSRRVRERKGIPMVQAKRIEYTTDLSKVFNHQSYHTTRPSRHSSPSLSDTQVGDSSHQQLVAGEVRLADHRAGECGSRCWCNDESRVD
jgi:hypothetical protein